MVNIYIYIYIVWKLSQIVFRPRIKLDLVESEKSSAEMHAETPFLYDYVTSRNSYCKRVMTSTAESKRVLKISNCTKSEDERTM